MLNLKEVITILLVSIILTFVVSLPNSFGRFTYLFVIVLIVILINVFTKKVISYYLDSEIEIKLWQIDRFGFRPWTKFKKAFPAGLILPLLVSIFSLGYLKWLASLVFEIKPKVYRAARRFGLYKFSEITEYHMGLIAGAGILANILFALLGYLTGYSEFAKINIYYAFFNLIPLSNLDGNKIFFGSVIQWAFLASIVMVGTLLALIII